MKSVRFAGIALLTLLAACGSPSNSDLPVKTILWDQPGDGDYRFYTNDKQYYDYGFFKYVNGGTGAFTNGTAVVRKVSGLKNIGYGVIFCYASNNTYYEVLVENYGYYSAWKTVNGTWTSLIPWTGSSEIYQSGAANTIAISCDGSATFSITINGSFVDSFHDTDLSADYFGIDAGVGTASEGENFPNHPVEVRGRITAPIVAPTGSSSDIEAARGILQPAIMGPTSGFSKQP